KISTTKERCFTFGRNLLRTSLDVKTRTLTYSGLEDFGGDIESKFVSSELTDHALVFMFQRLVDNVTQPISVFASKGPVKGVDLVQLIIKAIILLEDAGLQVMALTCDGASTNKTMLKQFGVSGKRADLKNYFTNPYDGNRNLNPSNNFIKWDHYRQVLNDSKSMLKICPKITNYHIVLNNLTKMKVKYATQIFSNSMAVGLQFYRTQNCNGFDDSLETQLFTTKINDMFDAMNRKFPAEGIRENSKDLEILNQSLEWLDQWELMLDQGLIEEKEFLTKNTAESLRRTLKSTIDLVMYLLKECDFKYVLTSKLNQDSLEKFFGIIRQTSGPKDHPSTPNFLQLYRLDTDYTPLITIQDLKNSINENDESFVREKKILILKSHIDEIIKERKWDMDDVFRDTDFEDDRTFNCIFG
ncbi:THAP-type domain-containing protein, partial [Aphis craccivora]